jgi:transcriptional regulator with XRE-family HTH domain
MAEHVGRRIAYWRKRRGGMTQTTLAGLSGVSQSYISQVEAGLKPIERRSTLISIAAALRITVADLLGQTGDPADPAKDAIEAAVPAIRAAIIEVEEGERRDPTRGTDEMATFLDQIDALRSASEYVQMMPLLPALLLDAAQYRGVPLIRAAYATSACLRHLGYRDLSLPAARIAVSAALDIEDPAWTGVAQYVHSHAMPIEAAGITSRIAERAVVTLQQDAADPSVRQMLGQMHLIASMACAVDGRSDEAAAHLSAARAEAESLGDPADGAGFHACGFGPTNVALWEMAVAIELGDFARVLELGRAHSPDPLRLPIRHQAYWMSMGRALAQSGKTDREALVAFMRAERVAPEPFALNPQARDSVVSMVHRARRRSVSDDLRTMARRLGVDVPV